MRRNSDGEKIQQRGTAGGAEAGRRDRRSCGSQAAGDQEDTLYGWRGRQKKRQARLEQELAGRSEADLLKENAKLRAQLLQAQQDVEILQEALGFFAKRWRQ